MVDKTIGHGRVQLINGESLNEQVKIDSDDGKWMFGTLFVSPFCKVRSEKALVVLFSTFCSDVERLVGFLCGVGGCDELD